MTIQSCFQKTETYHKRNDKIYEANCKAENGRLIPSQESIVFP